MSTEIQWQEIPIDAEIVSVDEAEDDEPGEAVPSAEETASTTAAAATTAASATEPFGDTPHPPYEFNSAQKVTIKQVAKEIVFLDPTWDYKQFLVECQKAAVMTRDVVTKLNGILMRLKAEAKEEQPA